jgi:hypothetical protein
VGRGLAQESSLEPPSAAANLVFAGPSRSFLVGHADRSYPGFRKITAMDWQCDRVMRSLLLSEHLRYGGWQVLDDPLVANAFLCVAEGQCRIDAQPITMAEYRGILPVYVRGTWAAANYDTQVPWGAMPPPLDGQWTVFAIDIKNWPCLFVRI